MISICKIALISGTFDLNDSMYLKSKNLLFINFP